ncbi:transcriptional repressor [Phocicoccus schoeneichii]|uniref:Ferric uptake regulation protein n=1 Tax=Phocicoccus schoeneichii TaxID=1812261 RepID=A0A6V7RHI0_9BACL|nr:Fur family transcriptional regulator [Jeotgalicoccus schoeneichii]GGH47864.1 transcriptional repressor [Jeotgalicoccus schoeneichii]CAD2077252.1 Ferric uptake regulation protein [Jeotgalicoccus schoeneichii]
MEIKIKNVKEQLHSAGFKLTPQREVTLKILLENKNSHLSAEDVFLRVKEEYPEIGLATVYRTLELLSDLQILEKMNFGDGVSRYDFRKTGTKHFNHHLICVKCGKVQEVEDDLLSDVEKIIEHEYGFMVMDHRLTFHGVCRECQLKEDTNETD